MNIFISQDKTPLNDLFLPGSIIINSLHYYTGSPSPWVWSGSSVFLSPFSPIFSTFVLVLKRLAPGHKDTIKCFTILGEIPNLQLTSCKNIIAAQAQIDYPSFLPLLWVGIKIMTRIRTRPDYYIPCTKHWTFCISEALLQHRPLPEVPPSSQDDISTLASLGFLHSLEGSGLRWTSRENLLIGCEDEDGDPQLFVALYDFQAGGENQLSLKKSEQVSLIFYTSPLNVKMDHSHICHCNQFYRMFLKTFDKSKVWVVIVCSQQQSPQSSGQYNKSQMALMEVSTQHTKSVFWDFKLFHFLI